MANPSSRSHRHRADGLTLIEMLVAIAIITVLLSILIVGLQSIRSNGQATVSIANLRSLGQTLQLYTGAHDGKLPFPPWNAEREVAGPLYWAPPGAANPVSHFYSPIWLHSRTFWPALLHDTAPWSDHYATWLSPGADIPDGPEPLWERARYVSYSYSNSFLGSPRIWTAEGQATRSDIGPVSEAIIGFPSAKVIFYDYLRPYLRGASLRGSPRPLLFCDGAASLLDDAKALPSGENSLTHSRERYHDTAAGAAGRDF